MKVKDVSREFKIYGKYSTLLLKCQRTIMLVSLLIVILGMIIEVLSRYIFKISIVGIEEFAAYVAIWLYFIGASYGSYERSHISAELVHLIFKDPKQYAKVRALTSFVTSIIIFYSLPWAYKYFIWGMTRKEISIATLFGSHYRVYYFQLAIFVGLLLMGSYSLIEGIQWMQPIIKGTSIPNEMMNPREEIESWI